MNLGASWCVLLAATAAVTGERWRFPEGASSVRIDTKVRFIDTHSPRDKSVTASTHLDIDHAVQADEVPFEAAKDTQGFYNRPPGAGRYPVRVESPRAPYRVDGHSIYPVDNSPNRRPFKYGSDGTLDSLQFCKCVSTPECNPRPDSEQACGPNQYLCCYKRPNNVNQQSSEYFNEIDDERPALLPNHENGGGPFAHPGSHTNGVFGNGFGQNNNFPNMNPEILIGPDGPTGELGPHNRPTLVGPGGPTGNIGPAQQNSGVLFGPGGPSGVIGPAPVNDRDAGSSASAQRGVLVGPGGPTGVIGPYGQRPVLVGPGGPTGIVGPGNQRGVLSGPRGPSGLIGPGYSRQPGLLVGPGGPTGIIGPGRRLLVGPGGPTGQIGPRRYFDANIENVKSKRDPVVTTTLNQTNCNKIPQQPQDRRCSRKTQKRLEHTSTNTRNSSTADVSSENFYSEHVSGGHKQAIASSESKAVVKQGLNNRDHVSGGHKPEETSLANKARIKRSRHYVRSGHQPKETRSVAGSHARRPTKTTRGSRRTLMRGHDHNHDKNHAHTTRPQPSSVTRKQIGDIERVPIFIFMIKVLDFVLRVG